MRIVHLCLENQPDCGSYHINLDRLASVSCSPDGWLYLHFHDDQDDFDFDRDYISQGDADLMFIPPVEGFSAQDLMNCLSNLPRIEYVCHPDKPWKNWVEVDEAGRPQLWW